MSAKMVTKEQFMEKYNVTVGMLNRAIHDYEVKHVKQLKRPDGYRGEFVYREGDLLLAVMNTWKESRDIHIKRAQTWQSLITEAKRIYLSTNNREE
ncbi:MAG: hypothetical protein IJ174_06660 [Clostridia bacterium]|nr:hypothetical protein [Clostridia bacterium]